jgi:hypothetical protein
MGSCEANEQVRKEWRDLGFFYDCDERGRRWVIVGSRSGLKKFCVAVRTYAADPRNAHVSEHSHYGPYMYLKLMTWSEPTIRESAIAGRPADLARLADLTDARLAASAPGDSFTIGREYAPNDEYVLEVRVEQDDFDPASADPLCRDAQV